MEKKEVMHKVIGMRLAKASMVHKLDNLCLLAIIASMGLALTNPTELAISSVFLSCGASIALQAADVCGYAVSFARTHKSINALKKIAKKATKILKTNERFADFKVKVLYEHRIRFGVFKNGHLYGTIDSDSIDSTLVRNVGMNEKESNAFVAYINKMLDRSFKKANNDKKRKHNSYGKLNIPKISIDNLDDVFLPDGGYDFALNPKKYLKIVASDGRTRRIIRRKVSKLSTQEKAEIITRILNGEVTEAQGVESLVARKNREKKLRRL